MRSTQCRPACYTTPYDQECIMPCWYLSSYPCRSNKKVAPDGKTTLVMTPDAANKEPWPILVTIYASLHIIASHVSKQGANIFRPW